MCMCAWFRHKSSPQHELSREKAWQGGGKRTGWLIARYELHVSSGMPLCSAYMYTPASHPPWHVPLFAQSITCCTRAGCECHAPQLCVHADAVFAYAACA